ncbi:MAG: hypothetical protein R3B09_17860 [Nannocystaceae bacterium]
MRPRDLRAAGAAAALALALVGSGSASPASRRGSAAAPGVTADLSEGTSSEDAAYTRIPSVVLSIAEADAAPTRPVLKDIRRGVPSEEVYPVPEADAAPTQPVLKDTHTEVPTEEVHPVPEDRVTPAAIEADAAPAYHCPAARSRAPDGDPRLAFAARLGASAAAIQGFTMIETPAIPGLVGLAFGVLPGRPDADEGDRARAAIAPILRCGDRLCAGEPRIHVGADRIEVAAIVDLVGRGETLDPRLGGRTQRAAAAGPCPRWPAALVTVRQPVAGGEEAVHELLALRPPLLAPLAGAYSRVGPEGGVVLESLRIDATAGGGPGDLLLVRRRILAPGSGCPSPIADVSLHVFVDDHYTHAPEGRPGRCH